MPTERARLLSIPNVLTVLRILSGPVLLALAWNGCRDGFIAVLALALVSDSIDGFLARRLHVTTEFGARLDSVADLTIIATLPLALYLLMPEVITREAVFVVTALICYLVPTGVGLLRFGRLTSYHTWGAKVCAVLVGVSVFIMLFNGSFFPFKLCIPLMILEAIDELLVTAILPEWHANVSSFYHAWRIRKSSGHGPDAGVGQSAATEGKPA